MSKNSETEKILLGISGCLLGEPVRFDGGHKRNAYIVQTLGRYFEFKSFCPEVDIGLGVPRDTLGLIEKKGEQRIVFNKDTKHDLTKALKESVARQAQWQRDICGYILKSRSPSCGIQNVELIQKDIISLSGIGIYAAGLMQNFPNLPVESEDRLENIELRNNFIRRIFVYRRWKILTNTKPGLRDVQHFHRQHSSLLMASDSERYKQLTCWLEKPLELKSDTLISDYEKQLMSILKTLATRKNNTHVLKQLTKKLSPQLNTEDKDKTEEIVRNYNRGLLSFNIATGQIRQYQQQHIETPLERDWYLDPAPGELALLSNTTFD